MEPSEILAPTVDKSQVPPLHQKRIVAFVNHFLIESCSFLNNFAENCDAKFIEIERKLQKLEAGLTILEAKLSSIPDEPHLEVSTKPQQVEDVVADTNTETTSAPPLTTNEPVIRVCEDERYKKFFKLVQVGAPANAVKLKMQAEGFDPNLLDTPNLVLPDAIKS